MSKKHRGFWLDLLTKIGVPLFAASLVGCLLKNELHLIHVILMTIGIALVYIGHRLEYHVD